MAANKQCMSRLQKEYKTLLRDPVPHISAHPSPTNLLEWHFVLEGDKDTDYKGGVYHGKIVFPPQYPFKPPSLSLYTPNGRFATNTKLCLSMTDYHPESWNPMWSVGTILTGLLSFMHDNQSTTGSITTTQQEKQQLARESLAFNLKNPMFKKLFPEWAEVYSRQQQQQAEPQQAETVIGQDSSADGLNADGRGVAVQGVVAAPGQRQAQQAGGQHIGGQPQTGNAAAPGAKPSTTLLTLAAVMMVVALAVGPIMHSWGSGYSATPHHH